jgi:hypothetical protein
MALCSENGNELLLEIKLNYRHMCISCYQSSAQNNNNNNDNNNNNNNNSDSVLIYLPANLTVQRPITQWT